jgi:hypothetical protein
MAIQTNWSYANTAPEVKATGAASSDVAPVERAPGFAFDNGLPVAIAAAEESTGNSPESIATGADASNQAPVAVAAPASFNNTSPGLINAGAGGINQAPEVLVIGPSYTNAVPGSIGAAALPLITMPASFSPAFVELTGGGAALDTKAAVAADLGKILQGTVANELKSYQVRAGVDATARPGIVRAANFDALTNPIVFVQL